MKTLKYFLLICLSFGLSSCSDFLEEKPETSIEKDGVYNSLGSARAALAGMYSRLSNYDYAGFNYFHVLNVTSGMGVSLKNNDVDLASLNIRPTNVNVSKAYQGIYSAICVANDIIEGMQKSTLPEAERNRIQGEAYLMRAVSYFNLVRMFGKLSIVVKVPTSYEENQKPRSEVSEVYEQVILPDLEAAFRLLPEPKDQETGHPHRWAARAYQAKVFQTLAGNDGESPYWKQCYEAAHEVYTQGVYRLVSRFADLFGEQNKNNPESILEAQFSAAVTNGRVTETTFPIGHELMSNITSRGKTWGKTRPSQRAFDQFDEQDPRREVTFVYGSYRNIFEKNAAKKIVMLYPTPVKEGKEKGWAYNTDSENAAWKKYASPTMTASATNCNYVFCRYTDIVMTLAEAANELGLTGEAADYLDEVLDRARDCDGNGTIDAGREIYPLAVSESERADREALRERIFRERLKEFSGECDEWFTIRRRGVEYLRRIMEEHNACLDAWYGGQGITKLPKYVYKYDLSEDNVKKNLLLPFPSDEINRNENIGVEDQNFGY